MNDYLRKQVKLLRALQGVKYKELAEHLEIKTSSFCNWMNNQYQLSIEKQNRL
jgi:DNA-directed RNA polymerase specialized sigma24 family protein